MKFTQILKGLLLSIAVGTSVTALAVVDINKANIAELQQLKGIGAKKATDIVNYREAHGSFKSVDELINVKGIGKATLEKLRGELTVDSVSQADSTTDNSDVDSKNAEDEQHKEEAVPHDESINSNDLDKKGDEKEKK